MKNGYNKFLTILFIVIIVGFLVLTGFWIYDKYQAKTVTEDADAAVDEFLELVGATNIDSVSDVQQDIQDNNNEDNDESNSEIVQTNNKKKNTSKKNSSSGSSSSYSPTYKGFPMVGTIEIPKTRVKYPILAEVTKKSIEKSVAVFYSPGLNQIGNTIIMGHNYRNGLFFSKNKNLEIGDKIYITDLNGNRLEYTIYDKYETSESDSSYLTLETNGTIEITLATCTDYDTSRRIIIRAKA